MIVGLLTALAAAFCYGTGSVLQAVGARRAAPAAGLDPRLLVRLVQQLPYLIGLGLDLAGFVFDVVALQFLPLFCVQALIAGSVGVTALGAVVVLHARLHRREVAALAALIVGLALLAAGSQPGPADPLGAVGQWVLLAAVVPTALAAVAASKGRGRGALIGLAVCAGVAFGGLAVAARGLALPHPLWLLVTVPAAWALVAFGGLGTLTFAAALQRGSVTVASAVMFAVETVLPAIIGVALLGDATRPGLGAVAAWAGFALTLAAAVALSPYGDLEGAVG